MHTVGDGKFEGDGFSQSVTQPYLVVKSDHLDMEVPGNHMARHLKTFRGSAIYNLLSGHDSPGLTL